MPAYAGAATPAVIAGDDLVVDPGLAQPQRLLAAAAEHERVAALQPHDPLPGLAVLDQQPVDLLLRHLRPAALLADVHELRLRPRVPQRARRDQAVVEHDVGRAEQLDGAEGEEPGVAGPGAHEEHRGAHAIASACASSSPAPAASIRRASSSPSPPASSIGDPHGPVGQSHEPSNRAVLRVDSHGCVTSGFQDAHGGPLGRESGEGGRVMHGPHRPPHTLVIGPRLERERPLAGRGDEVQRFRRPLDAQPVQPGRGEDDGVGLAGVELAQPRVDVAAQLDHVQIGPRRRAAPRGAGATRSPPGRPGGAPREDRPSLQSRPQDAPAPGRRAPLPSAASPPARSPAPARPARPSPSGPRGRSRPPRGRPRSCRPSATCRRRRAPGRRTS